MEALLNLKRNKGAKKTKKRLGRGNGSGLGTYSGKGGKGQTARTGGSIKAGFTGGQNPISRQLPKLKGFKNVNQVKFLVVNLSALNVFEDGTEVDSKALKTQGLIPNLTQPVKILGTGELTKKLTITAEKFSTSAKEKISKAGGTVKEIQ